MNVCYMKQKEEPTGTCAVLVKDNERSLIANLAAANKYDKARRIPTTSTRSPHLAR